jgi:Protein of unknown function (DUF3048) N-terminal domain
VNLIDRIGDWSTKQKVIAAAIAVVVVGGGVAGLSIALTAGGSTKKALARTTSPTPKSVATNPLTGVGAPPKGPVIGVKIDDTANGRPQLGVDKADIVYVEQAEGGLTRLLAVFARAVLPGHRRPRRCRCHRQSVPVHALNRARTGSGVPQRTSHRRVLDTSQSDIGHDAAGHERSPDNPGPGRSMGRAYRDRSAAELELTTQPLPAPRRSSSGHVPS